MDFSLDMEFLIQELIDSGQEISSELDLTYSLLRENFDDIYEYYDDHNFVSKVCDIKIINFAEEKLEMTNKNIEKFEETLEKISNYSREEKLFEIDEFFLEQLKCFNEINMAMRIKIEDYLDNLDEVRSLIDEIIFSLDFMRTGSSFSGNLIM